MIQNRQSCRLKVFEHWQSLKTNSKMYEDIYKWSKLHIPIKCPLISIYPLWKRVSYQLSSNVHLKKKKKKKKRKCNEVRHDGVQKQAVTRVTSAQGLGTIRRSRPIYTHWCLGRRRGRGPRWYDPRTASSASARTCPEAWASPGTVTHEQQEPRQIKSDQIRSGRKGKTKIKRKRLDGRWNWRKRAGSTIRGKMGA